jgi:hypothetical protein
MSSVFVLPNDTELTAYTFEVTLDGRLFFMQFKFNVRDSFWYMELSDGLTGAMLRSGIKIVSQWDLLRLYQEPERPAGTIIPIPLGEDGLEATALGQLGSDVLLTYIGES